MLTFNYMLNDNSGPPKWPRSKNVCLGRKGWPRSELAPMKNVCYNSLHVKPHFQFQCREVFCDSEML